MKKYVLGMLVLAISLVLAGCGGGGNTASTKINVTLTDFTFSPNTFTVPAGQEISFSGRNNGAVAHDFIIMKLGTDVGEKFDAEDEPNMYWKTGMQAGETSSATFTAPSEPGEYQVLCGIPGHLQAGMTGTLTVVP